MILFIAVLISIAFVVYLGMQHYDKMAWWEYAIIFIVPISMVLVGMSGVEYAMTRDTEYWGSLVSRATYEERWDEEVPCRHTKYCTRSVTDSNGRLSTETYACGTEHSYDVDDHPPEWYMTTTSGEKLDISSDYYNNLTVKFGNKTFLDMHRDYHSIDGDAYYTVWDNNPLKAEGVTTSHWYENRILVSNSIFKFSEVTALEKQNFALYDYPEINGNYKQKSILGDGGPSQAFAEVKLDYVNGFLGTKKQVRTYILLYKDKPLESGVMQQSLWQGGNKNEFVVAIGTDREYNIRWCHVFSWTDQEIVKIEARDFVMGQGKLDLVKLVEFLQPHLDAKFKRKQFKDFAYLEVEPPLWYVVLTFFLTISVDAGIAFWAISNEHDA